MNRPIHRVIETWVLFNDDRQGITYGYNTATGLEEVIKHLMEQCQRRALEASTICSSFANA